MDSHIVGDIGERWSEVEVAVGAFSLLVADAHAITAVPEEVAPP